MNTQDEGLARLNALGAAEAESELLTCCGSAAWARGVAARRPFADVAALLAAADEVWWGLEARDWLEAFGAHPRIGGKGAAPKQGAQAAGWSDEEQSGARAAGQLTLDELAAGNRAYEEKFGHI